MRHELTDLTAEGVEASKDNRALMDGDRVGEPQAMWKGWNRMGNVGSVRSSIASSKRSCWRRNVWAAH